MKTLYTLLLLISSNCFMTFAWYGHLKYREWNLFQDSSLFLIILLSWGLAFFEYCFQVPANRMGFAGNGGPFSLMELKVVQEVITLGVFLIFTLFFFRSEPIKGNHLIAFLFLIGAVYFAFKK